MGQGWGRGRAFYGIDGLSPSCPPRTSPQQERAAGGGGDGAHVLHGAGTLGPVHDRGVAGPRGFGVSIGGHILPAQQRRTTQEDHADGGNRRGMPLVRTRGPRWARPEPPGRECGGEGRPTSAGPNITISDMSLRPATGRGRGSLSSLLCNKEAETKRPGGRLGVARLVHCWAAPAWAALDLAAPKEDLVWVDMWQVQEPVQDATTPARGSSWESSVSLPGRRGLADRADPAGSSGSRPEERVSQPGGQHKASASRDITRPGRFVPGSSRVCGWRAEA